MVDEQAGDRSEAGNTRRAGAPGRSWILIAFILIVAYSAKQWVWIEGFERDSVRLDSPDAREYHASALSLIETGTLAESPANPSRPQLARTPAYPAFLAATYGLFGRDRGAAVHAQILLSLLTILLVYRLACERWGAKSAGAFAAILVSVDLASLVYSLRILTETLSAFSIAVVLFAGSRVWRNPDRPVAAAMLGCALAFATLVRPTTYYAIIPVALWLGALAVGARLAPRRILLVLALFTLPVAIAIGGWTLRNAGWTGEPEYSAISAPNLLYYKAAGVLALHEGVSLQEAQSKLGRERYYGEVRMSPDLRRAALERQGMQRRALQILSEHPVLYLRIVAGGVRDTLGDSCGGLIPFFIHGPARAWISDFANLYLVVLYGSICAGLAWLGFSRRANGFDVFAIGIIVYVLVASAGPGAYCRYRIPIVPVLAVYAAAAVSLSSQALERARSKKAPR